MKRTHAAVGVLAVLLALSGCARGAPVGFRVASLGIRYRPATPSGLEDARKRTPPAPTVDGGRVAERPERRFTSGERALQAYKDFILGRRKALASLSPEERRVEEAALREMEWWLWQQDEALLARCPG